MAHTQQVSGTGLAYLGVPLQQGRAEFRTWAKEQEEEGAGRPVHYGMAVERTKDSTLVYFGTFAGLEVYFYADNAVPGVVVLDVAWQQAWRFYELTEAADVIRWADGLGLHPRMMAA